MSRMSTRGACRCPSGVYARADVPRSARHRRRADRCPRAGDSPAEQGYGCSWAGGALGEPQGLVVGACVGGGVALALVEGPGSAARQLVPVIGGGAGVSARPES